MPCSKVLFGFNSDCICLNIVQIPVLNFSLHHFIFKIYIKYISYYTKHSFTLTKHKLSTGSMKSSSSTFSCLSYLDVAVVIWQALWLHLNYISSDYHWCNCIFKFTVLSFRWPLFVKAATVSSIWESTPSTKIKASYILALNILHYFFSFPSQL